MSREYSVRQRFVEAGSGRLYVTEYQPDEPPDRAVVMVPPFAEEMNRCRRMMNLQARALAEEGCLVVLPDLFGTGDSEGDFGDARWTGWRADIASLAREAGERTGCAPALLGIRLGALLLFDSVFEHKLLHSAPVLWNPALDGKRYLKQFLRLRIASDLIASGAGSVSTTDLWNGLEAGESIEVAGYLLSSSLAMSIAEASIDPVPMAGMDRIDWLETVADAERGPSVGARRECERWRREGLPIELTAVEGPGFWQTAEIAVAPELIALTTAKLIGGDVG